MPAKRPSPDSDAVPGQRLHRGDIMSAATRSAVMARIRGTGTGPELLLERLLRSCRRRFEMHARDLPGRPDFLFRKARVAVFVDGDFWHGWRFPLWRLKLSEKWEAKIEANRRRDRRNHARLRRAGWTVIRIWEHQLAADETACLRRVMEAVNQSSRPCRAYLVASTASDSSAGNTRSNGN